MNKQTLTPLITRTTLILFCAWLSSCALPPEFLAGGKDARVRRAEIPADGSAPPSEGLLPAGVDVLAPADDLAASPQDAASVPAPANISDAGAMDLSDEVVPYEQFARGRDEQYRTVTERIDDAVFAQNRERRSQIEQRSMDDTETDLPDRRSFFGGDRFLSPGPINPGIKMPTGATWRPTFFAYGSMRSALQTFNQGPKDITEWTNRLDVFGNLYLSGTERFLVGFRPFDHEGEFSGYTFDGGSRKAGWGEALNLEPQTLFFEGDLGELFPFLDPQDRHSTDYQFSIGRQPLVLQDGMMLNDSIDAVGVSRHNLYLLGASSARLTGFVGLNDVHRADNIEDTSARLYALSSAFDYDRRTVEVDAAYVSGSDSTGGDGAYLGIGHIQRFGHWNSTLRGNASWALDEDSPAVGTGYLLTHELSRTMPHGEDILYLNTYLGIDQYTSAARGPATGGPLGRLGLLNRAVGIGGYGAPLTNKSGDTLGASLGYQHFLDPGAFKQLLVELGGRTPYDGGSEKSVGALGAQYQWGFGRGLIFVLGGFGSIDEDGDTGYGARTELLVKF